jgi:hypothetical protein
VSNTVAVVAPATPLEIRLTTNAIADTLIIEVCVSVYLHHPAPMRNECVCPWLYVCVYLCLRVHSACVPMRAC